MQTTLWPESPRLHHCTAYYPTIQPGKGRERQNIMQEHSGMARMQGNEQNEQYISVIFYIYIRAHLNYVYSNQLELVRDKKGKQ